MCRRLANVCRLRKGEQKIIDEMRKKMGLSGEEVTEVWGETSTILTLSLVSAKLNSILNRRIRSTSEPQWALQFTGVY